MRRIEAIGLVAIVLSIAPALRADSEKRGVENVVKAIESLEGKSDPKCHATATRLENFMYGTPLTAEARDRKVELQKQLILSIWKSASEEARASALASVDGDLIAKHLDDALLAHTTTTGDVVVQPRGGEPIELEERDVRQYSSVAYALRAILAVQQDALFDPSLDLVPMEQGAIDRLKWLIDTATLATLKTSDTIARRNEALEIDGAIFETGWGQVIAIDRPQGDLAVVSPDAVEPALLLRQIIEQKVASYDEYHAGRTSGQLLYNNVRSFYARHEWPEERRKIDAIQSIFIRLMTNITAGYIDRAEQIAEAEGRRIVREPDVARVLDATAPFEINEYEDITYFYRLPRREQVQIESYDADSFRDSGLHWVLIRNVLESPEHRVKTDFDPFAAELLAEGVAQMGVLLFRVAGMVAKEEGAPVLAPEHLIEAAARIDTLMDRHLATPESEQHRELLASSRGTTVTRGEYFVDVTDASGIDYIHRPADWVKRFERSFMYVNDEDVEPGADEAYLLDVPPVFGGSGIGASDLDGDGIDELLILGGLGNRLYKGAGDGTFVDVTSRAGISWVGPDGRPGEPRQPLLVDFDNDGRRDIFISYVDAPHRLYRNMGDLRFEDVTDRAALGGKGLVGSAATAADFDRDGLVDLYISYYGNYLKGDGPTLARVNEGTTPNRLFRNRGGFRFEDVTEGSGADNSGWTQAAAAVDFDGDGWQDLIVGNDFGVNGWYRNNGDWTFENVVEKLDALHPSNSMNVGTSDLNRDGYPDVYISNIFYMVKDEKYVMPTEKTPMKRDPEKLGTMRIFDANHLFTSIAEDGRLAKYAFSFAVDRGETATGWAWDADFFDFDHDADDDLYVVNGLNEYNIFRPKRYDGDDGPVYARPGYESSVNVREPNVFFVNEDGKLRNRSRGSGADLEMNARGAVYLDIDRDGDLDIVVGNYHEKAVVLENEVGAGAGAWAKIELIGDPSRGSNRDAIGSTAIAITPAGERIWRSVQAGTGYLSDHPKALHFGLGEADRFDLLVRWPDGEERRYENLEPGRVQTIVQGEPDLRDSHTTTRTDAR